MPGYQQAPRGFIERGSGFLKHFPEELGAGIPTSSSFTVADYDGAELAGEMVFSSASDAMLTFSQATLLRPTSSSDPFRGTGWTTIWARFPTRLESEVLDFQVAIEVPLDLDLLRRWEQTHERELHRVQFLAERESFFATKPELLRQPKYQNKFVAVIDRKVVDLDADDQQLAARIIRNFGYRPAYIGYVGELKPELFIPPS